MLAARLGQTYSMLGVERSQRPPVSIQTPGIQSYLAFACQVFDLPVPDLYVRKGQAGGWRRVMSEAQVERVVAQHREALMHFGYLNPDGSIPAARAA